MYSLIKCKFNDIKNSINRIINYINHNVQVKNYRTSNPVTLFIDKIMVSSENDKQELLRVIEFIHDHLKEIDDVSVYDFCHLYLTPEVIEIRND